MKTKSFGEWIQEFFADWLGKQRNLSPNTVASYRDAWMLYLRWLTDLRSTQVSRLTLADLRECDVLKFLNDCEKRGNTVGTRNCRLAALKGFASFVLDREPMFAGQYTEIMRIPFKKGPRHQPVHMEWEEFQAIVDQVDRSKREGERDYLLLWVLINTGARIQEALEITPAALRLEVFPHVRLLGKGRRERTSPLWPETAKLFRAFIGRNGVEPDRRVFTNKYGDPLGAAGVRFKLNGYIGGATTKMPSLRKKRITPHTFRHSAGVLMVQSKVAQTEIQSLLGHVSIDTTNHYARANLATKRDALERVAPGNRPVGPAGWKKDPDVLRWLGSL